MLNPYPLPSRSHLLLEQLDRLRRSECRVNDSAAFARNGMRGPDGMLKALWVNTDVRVLYSRKDLVSEPADDMARVDRAGVRAVERDLTGYLSPAAAAKARRWSICPCSGRRPANSSTAGKPTFATARNRAAMLNLLGFPQVDVDFGASPSRVANDGFEADRYPEILGGNVAMFLGGNWMAKQLRELGDKTIGVSRQSR